jgi:hypothetical protein
VGRSSARDARRIASARSSPWAKSKGRHSKPINPEKALEDLQDIHDPAAATTRNTDKTPRSAMHILTHDITRRLGPLAILQLVADYGSGQTTTQLMEPYALSKTPVLKLLTANGVTIRRQPLTELR